MAKENYIKFRCSDDFKSLVERQAKEHGRSISSYIEYLIRKDVDTMRVVYNDFITDEMEKTFKAEESIYLSTDGEKWLFTDMEVFNEMDKKFQFDIDTEERDHVYNVNMEDYLNNRYEEDRVEYFGLYIEYTEYSELVLEIMENNEGDLCCDTWEEVIDKWMKAVLIDGIKMEMEEIFEKMIDDGWDIRDMKDVVSNALYTKGIK